MVTHPVGLFTCYTEALHDVKRRVTRNVMARETNLPHHIQLRLSESLARRIDDWRRTSSDIPTRSEAIRRLLDSALSGGSA